MIPRPRVRPQGFLQAVTRPSCLSSRLTPSPFSRSVHNLPVPELANGKDAVFKKYGVPGLFSPATYEETWTQYEAALCKAIADETDGTSLEGRPVKAIHIDTSKQPSKAVLYNLAAQAHHNHFFFNALSADPEPYHPSGSVAAAITEWFESFDHLRDEITDVAMSMFGNGYVWLMADASGSGPGMCGPLRILATYNAGSPFAEAHQRRQGVDGNTGFKDMTEGLAYGGQRAGAFGDFSKNFNSDQPYGFKGNPVLCLKVWEHQWMRDYGLAGKERYVRNWWNRVDWDEVNARINAHSSHVPRPQNIMSADARALYDRTTNLPSA